MCQASAHTKWTVVDKGGVTSIKPDDSLTWASSSGCDIFLEQIYLVCGYWSEKCIFLNSHQYWILKIVQFYVQKTAVHIYDHATGLY